MNKKLLTILAPLAVVIGLAVVPMTAQAAFWTSNNVKITEKTAVIGWGTLTLSPTVGSTNEITCHNAVGGFVENVAGVGKGSTNVFGSYDCESNFCPAEPFAKPVKLPWHPWPSHLITEGSNIRSETTEVQIAIGCEKEGTNLGSVNFVGANKPLVNKGTSALHPGTGSFGPGSGELEAEGSGGTVRGETIGEVKTLGAEEQELVNAHL